LAIQYKLDVLYGSLRDVRSASVRAYEPVFDRDAVTRLGIPRTVGHALQSLGRKHRLPWNGRAPFAV